MKTRMILTGLIGGLLLQTASPLAARADVGEQTISGGGIPVAASDYAAEATDKLQTLLRIDTTNPPGNEAVAAKRIADWLRDEGIESTLYESAPGRMSVVARLKGRGDLPPLLLLNHLDVVLAEPAGWTHPPFGGIIADGALWGRGALDMKSLGVMELIAFLELKRRHVSLARDVIFCATPDEEDGAVYGVEWLLKHHPEAVACSEVLNEGGAGSLMPSGAAVMGIQTAERGFCWLRITAQGAPGHGSIDRPDGATRRLVRALNRLETAERRLEVVPEAEAFFHAVAETETGLRGFILHHLANPLLLKLVGPTVLQQQPILAPMLANSANVTVLKAGDKVNVMPGTAVAEVDIRMLPGYTVAQMTDWARRTLADPDLKVEVIFGRDGSRSPATGPLFSALTAAAKAEYPGLRVTQMLTPGGFTDSSLFRARGVHCYGLLPIITSAAQLATIHGHNEYISLAQLAAGTRVVVRAVAQASGVTR